MVFGHECWPVSTTAFGGCWHPNYIKDWTPEADPDAKFNRSTVPLQPRFYGDEIKANANQYYEGKVAACLTMNPMASQTPSQGANNFIGYNPTYWQYMDLLIWWGGSAGEGIIVLPSAPVVDIAHLNGVKVLANVFFPPSAFGGQVVWVNQMLTKEGNTYPYAAKLYEIAKYYGFDGWFLNEETVGGNKTAWSSFIKYYYELAEADGNFDMEIQWYDMGTQASGVGAILENKNASFFANYGSANSSTITSNMNYVKGLGFTQEEAFSKVYHGVENAQGGLSGNSSGFLACFPTGGHAGSIDLFNPEEHIWKKVVENYLGTSNAQGATAYNAMKTVFSNEARFWTNIQNDPSSTVGRGSGTWPGLANGIQERSTIQTKPFVTSFSAGLGKHRFVNGENKGTQDWYHRGMQDIMPTWRWWVEGTNGGTRSDISFDLNWDDAYNVGTSIEVKGNLKANADYLTRLYKTNLAIVEGDKFELVYKTAHAGTMEVKLATSEANTTFATFPVVQTSTQNGWSIASIDLSSLAGKTVSIIALNFKSATDIADYKVQLGQLGIMAGSYSPAASPINNLTAQNELKEEISDVRLIWDAPADMSNIHHFNVYMERDGVKTLVGQTRNEGFYVSKFTRTATETDVKLSVSTVTKDLKEGNEVSITMNYPEIGLSEVSLKASKTLVKIGEELTVTARANNYPISFNWVVPANSELVSQTGNTAIFKFSAEGTYDIKVTVTNQAGAVDCEVTKFIEVSDSKVVENLAKGKKIHSVSGYIDPEKPEWLIDGVEVPSSVRDKWCVGGSKSHWVIIDLEAAYKLYQFKIFDCGHKENYSDNFKNFKIELSTDLTNWTTALDEKSRPENTKDDWVKPTVARYVRFTPYDEEMPITIRIWEFQAFGVESNLSLEAKENQIVNINTTLPLSLSYSLGGDAKEDNFDISVVASNSLITIANKVVSADKVTFDVVAGANAGKSEITVVLTNGEYSKSVKVQVVVQDPDNTNLLLNRQFTLNLDGSGYDVPNNENNTTGPVGPRGINDGREDTYWNSPYANNRVANHVLIFDLEENYLINSFVAKFREAGMMKRPTAVEIFVSLTGEEDDYVQVDKKSGSFDLYEINPQDILKARYLKFVLSTKSYYGFSLVELEAWGKKDEVSTGMGSVEKGSFSIYPNPVRRGDSFKIEVETGGIVKVMSLTGATIISEVSTGDVMSINTNNMQPGVYIVTKQVDNKTQTAKLIVK